MLELVLIGYLAFRNSVRARQKGLNSFLWASITVICFLFAFSIGLGFVAVNFLSDTVNFQHLSSPDLKIRTEAAQQLVDNFSRNPLHYMTVELFGIGGYLLIRYILDRKPNKKQPEVHWMDKLGENR